MKVLYNGFSGLLWRFELVDGSYELDIFDHEKSVEYRFTDVDENRVEFLTKTELPYLE